MSAASEYCPQVLLYCPALYRVGTPVIFSYPEPANLSGNPSSLHLLQSYRILHETSYPPGNRHLQPLRRVLPMAPVCPPPAVQTPPAALPPRAGAEGSRRIFPCLRSLPSPEGRGAGGWSPEVGLCDLRD